MVRGVSVLQHTQWNPPRALLAQLAVFVTIILVASNLCAETLLGRVTHVRDGDTIVLQGVPIRLEGVSAPELKQKWSRAFKDAMQRIVAGKRLRCELTGERTYDRKVGVCYLDDSTDIGAEIIGQGHARHCLRYSGRRYAAYTTEKGTGFGSSWTMLAKASSSPKEVLTRSLIKMLSDTL